MLNVSLFWLILATCVGCQDIMLTTVGLLVDHSTVHLVYNAKVRLQFSLGDQQFTATRYARITYRTGFDGQYHHACTGPGVSDCQYDMTSEYFVGLPDGNIASIGLGSSVIDGRFGHIAVGEKGRLVGRIFSILSDKFPTDPSANRMDSGCHPIIHKVRDELYGTPKGEFTGYPVEVDFERLRDDAAVGEIDSLNYFYHGPHCAALIKEASRDVVVTTRPQAKSQ